LEDSESDMVVEGYDVIGDIHGYAATLKQSLARLGYQRISGVYQHARRKALFLGDYIDRGPFQEETLEIVQSMVAEDRAYAIMGNHEYNAIAFYTLHEGDGGFLRPRSEKNVKQHRAFLDEFESRPAQWQSVIEWFKTLPLWLDLGGIRAIHACWDQQAIDALSHYTERGQYLSDELLHSAAYGQTSAFRAVENLLKGKEVSLPNGHYYHDKEGVKRHRMRVRWWDGEAHSYQRAFMGPEHERTHIPNDPIEGDHLIEYRHDAPPLFLGHYWLSGEPSPLAPNIACLDYSVAKQNGQLVAYRWCGETVLKRDHFVAVQRVEP